MMVSRRIILSFFVVLGGLISAVGSASAYTLWDPYGDGVNVKWPDDKIPVEYYIDAAGSDDIPDDQDIIAIQESFAAWSNVPTTYISATYKGAYPGIKQFRDDGFNVLFWVETITGEFSVYFDANTLGITVLTGTGKLREGYLTDVDIGFNGANFSWSAEPTGVSGKADVQSIATHEIGHFFGLDHTNVVGATMYPYGSLGDTTLRTLEQDDIDAISAVYPYTGVLNFAASPVSVADASWIVLTWRNPPRLTYERTMIRYRTDGVYPATINDGILLADIPVVPGQTSFYSHTGTQPNMTYFYTAFLYDNRAGFMLPNANCQRAATAIGLGGAVDDDGGGCFVATLCYGDYHAPAVRVLRRFRDCWLTRLETGRFFIAGYYAASPALCRYIEHDAAMKDFFRMMLDPLVAAARLITGGGQ
ncbi:MAG: matrixin family metalloprotease [Candidatus Omnitrophica bacterium]|nr:matrixin family metalloprotease [Candidatus Omnitrophota bacterium]